MKALQILLGGVAQFTLFAGLFNAQVGLILIGSVLIVLGSTLIPYLLAKKRGLESGEEAVRNFILPAGVLILLSLGDLITEMRWEPLAFWSAIATTSHLLGKFSLRHSGSL